MFRPLLAAAALPCALFATNAAAQTSESDSKESKEPRRYRVALGPQLSPSYPGADNLTVSPMVDVGVARGNDQFDYEAADESFGFPMIRGSGFSMGPALNFQSGRKHRETDPGVDEVGTTVEVGGYAQYWLAPGLRVRVEARQGIGGHKGLIGNAGLDYVARDGDRWLFALGPRIAVSNSRFQDAWFRVTPREALASGLPAYDPGGAGVHAVGASATGLMQMTPRWGLYGYAKYDRLVGDAARSPIVRDYGSRNQISGGLGLSFTFGRGVGSH
jgi:outer membrane scaffolding protein for murein synthesis (MipA/OmpV family)